MKGTRQLPQSFEKENLPSVPTAYNVYGGWPALSPDYAHPRARLAHYLWVINRHRWKILSFIAVCTIASAIVSSFLTPIFESTATIDIDRHMPVGIFGQESAQYPSGDADQFLGTQLRLIQSDSVLRPVVQRFKLTVFKQARWANLRFKQANPEETPMQLRGLHVERIPNTFLLLIRYRSADPWLAAEVANAIANSYILHSYTIRYQASASLSAFMEKQLEELKSNMERSSAALVQFERELNVINPEEKTSISSARLLQLNTEYTNAQSDRLKKEAAFNSVSSGSVEAAAVSTQGDVLKKLSERLGEAEERFAQVKEHYGENHPEYRRAMAQIAQLQTQINSARQNITRGVEIEYRQAVNRENMLKEAVARTKAEFDSLNAHSFQYQALKREADADKKLYEELTRKIKEAGINAGFQNSLIRLADAARPALAPVSPNTTLNVILAFILSTLLAIGAVVILDSFDTSVHNPKEASRLLNAEVIGTLPTVKSWHRVGGHRPNRLSERAKALPPVSVSSGRTATSFEEAIRTLRNSIVLGSGDQPLKSILVTSAFPKEGKTTIAASLAIAHAQQKHRTLLADCDMRCASVCKVIGLRSDRGFSKALLNGMKWRQEISQIDGLPELDILAAGPESPEAVDLVGAGLVQVLAEAKEEYDLVIVDAPPLLGFPEPLQMAAAVDGVVVIALAGQTDRQALESLFATLQRIRANLVGLVLNEATENASYGYSYRRENA